MAAHKMLREKNSRIRDVQTNFILSCKRTTKRTTVDVHQLYHEEGSGRQPKRKSSKLSNERSSIRTRWRRSVSRVLIAFGTSSRLALAPSIRRRNSGVWRTDSPAILSQRLNTVP